MVRMRMIALVLAFVTIGAGSALSATIYEAELTPENVVPDSGVDAYGQATLIVSDDETSFFLTVNFAGLDTPQTAARLLQATNENPGNELLPLPLGTPLALTLEYTVSIADALVAEELAIQIYSEAWPGGALRGNFDFVTVGVTETTWSRVKTYFD